MLGPAQADALGIEIACCLRIGRRVGVGAHLDISTFCRPLHEGAEIIVQSRLLQRRSPCKDLPGRAVDRHFVTCTEHAAIC